MEYPLPERPETPPTTPALPSINHNSNGNIGIKIMIIVVVITHFVLCAILVLSGLDLSMHGIRFSLDSSVQMVLAGSVVSPTVYFWKQMLNMGFNRSGSHR